MWKFAGWTATVAALGLLVWQASTTDPLWPRLVSDLLLVTISVLAGLRIGADSAAAYTTDLHRLNKVLADQNDELEEANAICLKQVASESSSKTA